MLHYETVSSDLINVLKKLQSLPELSGFRLVGGTSLALQIGHRISVDIDLFSDKEFDAGELQKTLYKTFSSFEVHWAGKNGFTSNVDNIKVDFFDWHVPFVKHVVKADDFILADKEDIAAMKFETITARKEKKDFIDIAFLLKEYSLKDLLSVYRLKYPFINTQFVIESLMAVDYADNTVQPNMIIPYEWLTAKQFIITNVTDYINEMKTNVIKQQQERLNKAERLLKKKRKED